MTNIVGTIGFAFTGRLGIRLNGVVVDDSTTPDTVFLPNIEQFFSIISGVITSASFPETESKNVSAHFSIYTLDDDDPPGVILPAIWEFDAIVPNASSVDFAFLTPTGVVNNQLDTSAIRIAKIIANDPSLAAKVAGAPFPRGEYDNGETYLYGEMVSYFGKNYISKSVTPITGILPTVEATWYELVISVPPEISVVATGSDAAYAVGWNGSLLVPTQNAVYDKINTIDSSITTANTNIANLGTDKANLASPTFTGDPKAPTPPTSDNDTSIATSAYVKANLLSYTELAYTNTQLGLKADLTYTDTQLGTKADDSAVAAALALKANLASPTFTGNPIAPTQSATDDSTRLATTGFVQHSARPSFLVRNNTNQDSNGDVFINFNSEVYDTNSAFSTNVFTAPVAGYYIFGGGIQIQNLDATARPMHVALNISSVDYVKLGEFVLQPSQGSLMSLSSIPVFLSVASTVRLATRLFGASFNYRLSTDLSFFWGYRLPI